MQKYSYSSQYKLVLHLHVNLFRSIYLLINQIDTEIELSIIQ